MDQATINVFFAVGGFFLSVFAANWLNQRFVERMVNQNREEMRDLITAQTKVLDAKLGALDTKLDSLKTELHSLTARVDRLERTTEQRFDRIERQLDAIFKPVISKTGD